MRKVICMDTYFSVSSDCVKCGRCTKVCQEGGMGFLGGGRGEGPVELDDCGGLCAKLCHYGAISISRW